MQSYMYQAPLSKLSTKSCEVKNTNNETIGTIERYFQNAFQKTVDSLLGKGNYFVRLKAYDKQQNKQLYAWRKNYLFRKSDNYIHFDDGDEKELFHARQLNHTIFDPTFIIKGDSIEIMTKTTAFDWVTFYEGADAIARWRTKASEKYKTYIEIEDHATIQHPLFYVLIGHMLYFIG